MRSSLRAGMELVLTEESGRYYATAKQASITSTFDEATCKSLVGTKLPGRISKVQCDPYEYTIKETGEVITLSTRWTYNPNEAALDEMVYEKSLREQSLLSNQRKGGGSLLFFLCINLNNYQLWNYRKHSVNKLLSKWVYRVRAALARPTQCSSTRLRAGKGLG